MPQEDHSYDVPSQVENPKSASIDLTQDRNVICSTNPTIVETPLNTPTESLGDL